MTFENIFPSLKTNYSSREDDILAEIYRPCFGNAIKYYRGTAYFRASVLELYKPSVLDFCMRNAKSKISILTSTEVMPRDAENILLGYSMRDLELSLEYLLSDEKTNEAAKFICSLIASKRLDIHVVKGSLYHDKVGFFEDSSGNIVSFAGSGNETIAGVSKGNNFERYILSWTNHPCFASYGEIWASELTDAIDHGIYADAEIFRFDELSDFFLKKHQITEDLEQIQMLSSPKFNYFNYDLLSTNGPQPHQVHAVNGWKNNDQLALFEHATGTYKTASGLMCADYFLGDNDTVVISSPLRMVSENWHKLIKRCFDRKIQLVKCWSENLNWDEEALHHIRMKEKVILVFVNDSLWSEKGQDLLKILKDDYFLIGDEAHNWEVASAKNFMNTNHPISRLALTAQLSEPGLEHETHDILEYFSAGKKQYVDVLSLQSAIENRFLRTYEYNLYPVNLSQKFLKLKESNKNAKLIWEEFSRMKRQLAPEIAIKTLQSKARVLVYTGPKIDHAVEIISQMQTLWNRKQSLPTVFKKMTGRENAIQRKNIIRDFTSGLTQSLVAIMVLDEGVDLPICDAAVMCRSNAKYRQWVQRRGRVLRKKDPSDTSKALVIDFILNLTTFSAEMQNKLNETYTSEVKRMLEFGGSSERMIDDLQQEMISLGWN